MREGFTLQSSTKRIDDLAKSSLLTAVTTETVDDSLATIGDFLYLLGFTIDFELVTGDHVIVAEHAAGVMTAVRTVTYGLCILVNSVRFLIFT